jgi:hypothetical protein
MLPLWFTPLISLDLKNSEHLPGNFFSQILSGPFIINRREQGGPIRVASWMFLRTVQNYGGVL